MKYTVILLLMAAAGVYGQDTRDHDRALENAVALALANNKTVQAGRYELLASRQLKHTAGDIGKTSVTGMFGQYNSYARNDNNFTVTQTIPFPTTFGARAALGKAHVRSSELQLAVSENELVYEVRLAWYTLAYSKALAALFQLQDSVFRTFAHAAEVRERTGEATLLEKITAESRARQAGLLLQQNAADLTIARQRLQVLLDTTLQTDAEPAMLEARLAPDTMHTVGEAPVLQWYRQQAVVAERDKAVQKHALLPDITLGYFNQTLIGTPNPDDASVQAGRGTRFQGFSAGISLPLWSRPYSSRIKAAEMMRLSHQSRYEQEKVALEGELAVYRQELQKYSESLAYYRDTGLPQADLIVKQSAQAYRSGEIGYVEYLQGMATAADLRSSYWQTLFNYNQTVIRIEYILGER